MQVGSAILEKNFSKIKNKFLVSREFVDFTQIDVCDGIFVPSRTFASSGRTDSFKKFRRLKLKKPLELDMMVDFENNKRKWVKVINITKPNRVVIHFDSILDWNFVFDNLNGIEIGLGVHLNNKKSEVFKLLAQYPFSYVQVMGIEKVGYGGQSISPLVYKYLQALRKKFNNLTLAVDGGVKVSNVKKLKSSGANRVAVGSGLFKFENGVEEAVNLFHKI